MNFTGEAERPSKKRRFFVDDFNSPPPSSTPEDALSDAATPPNLSTCATTRTTDGFDVELLRDVIGEELSLDTVQKLQELSGGNVERGIV